MKWNTEAQKNTSAGRWAVDVPPNLADCIQDDKGGIAMHISSKHLIVDGTPHALIFRYRGDSLCDLYPQKVPTTLDKYLGKGHLDIRV